MNALYRPMSRAVGTVDTRAEYAERAENVSCATGRGCSAVCGIHYAVRSGEQDEKQCESSIFRHAAAVRDTARQRKLLIFLFFSAHAAQALYKQIFLC